MMYPNYFRIFPTSSMCSNQWVHQKSTTQPKTNKMTATGSQIKLKIGVVWMIFNANYKKCKNNSRGGVEGC